MNAINPADILRKIEADIRPWCVANKANLSLATDAWNVLELLAESPAGLRVILHWEGDDDAGSHESAGIVENTIKVVLSHNRGLLAAPGANLTEGRAGQKPLYELLSDLRSALRAIEWPDRIASKRLFYKGSKSVIAPDGLPLDAREMTLTLHTTLPALAPANT
ncbi:MAG: hypothetical protein NTY01_08435 [Verrucomicrobia bacterium]|nr:hypothetical protein [Verrucomicrobiota bacterium]